MSNKKKEEQELFVNQPTETVYDDPAILRDSLLEELLQAEPFAFDLNTDALYRQYRDSYNRQGREAAADAFGRAATLTGGYANSYARGVAAQTYDDYMLALQDKGLELYEKAYDRYRDARDYKADLYQLASKREQEEYDRLQAAEKEAYEREQDSYEREKDAYKQEQDEQKQAYDKRQDALSFAYKMAQLGDFSYLQAAGVDVSGLQAAQSEKENAPEKISVSIQNAAEEYYYTYGYNALVTYLNRQVIYGQITEKGKNQIIRALTGRG